MLRNSSISSKLFVVSTGSPMTPAGRQAQDVREPVTRKYHTSHPACSRRSRSRRRPSPRLARAPRSGSWRRAWRPARQPPEFQPACLALRGGFPAVRHGLPRSPEPQVPVPSMPPQRRARCLAARPARQSRPGCPALPWQRPPRDPLQFTACLAGWHDFHSRTQRCAAPPSPVVNPHPPPGLVARSRQGRAEEPGTARGCAGHEVPGGLTRQYQRAA